MENSSEVHGTLTGSSGMEVCSRASAAGREEVVAHLRNAGGQSDLRLALDSHGGYMLWEINVLMNTEKVLIEGKIA